MNYLKILIVSILGLSLYGVNLTYTNGITRLETNKGYNLVIKKNASILSTDVLNTIIEDRSYYKEGFTLYTNENEKLSNKYILLNKQYELKISTINELLNVTNQQNKKIILYQKDEERYNKVIEKYLKVIKYDNVEKIVYFSLGVIITAGNFYLTSKIMKNLN